MNSLQLFHSPRSVSWGNIFYWPCVSVDKIDRWSMLKIRKSINFKSNQCFPFAINFWNFIDNFYLNSTHTNRGVRRTNTIMKNTIHPSFFEEERPKTVMFTSKWTNRKGLVRSFSKVIIEDEQILSFWHFYVPKRNERIKDTRTNFNLTQIQCQLKFTNLQ